MYIYGYDECATRVRVSALVCAEGSWELVVRYVWPVLLTWQQLDQTAKGPRYIGDFLLAKEIPWVGRKDTSVWATKDAERALQD